MPSDSIAVGWRLSSVSGWGILGLNLVLQLQRMGRNPVLYMGPHRLDVDPEVAQKLKPLWARQTYLEEALTKLGLLEFDFPVLHALRNGFEPPLDDQVARGTRNLGLLAFEDTEIDAAAVARARTYDLMVFSSEWNRRIAAARGIEHSYVLYQGADLSLFRPRSRVERYPGRFVVFSGGKLEYRKAQDIVIAAFRTFRQRHPDALLMLAWGNQWPGVLRTIARSPHVEGAPEIGPDGTLRIGPWLARNGLPEGSFVDLGMPPNRAMPEHLACADVALFPNRCEPATNLVAMETMAAGLPAIVAPNTGQAEIAGAHAITLTRQSPVAPYDMYRGTEGWAEPDLEETVEALETAYQDVALRTRLGAAGAKFVERFDWSIQVPNFVAQIDALERDS
jgi:glycosyltransferase involved in cell wall biosynthesis